jgi:hypothetical protein
MLEILLYLLELYILWLCLCTTLCACISTWLLCTTLRLLCLLRSIEIL